MAFPEFHDNTFVAFCDISGFKNKLAQNSQRAVDSLSAFYQIIYNALGKTRGNYREPVYGLVVSDCAILVVDNRNGIPNQNALKSLLLVIKEINNDSLPHDLMFTTSIAFGHFDYTERAEFFGIEKNMVTGAAYINAFVNQSGGMPKLKCGQCRIVPDNLPIEVKELLESQSNDEVFRMVMKENRHYYFYWMRESPNEIAHFKEEFDNTENLKFLGIRLLLLGHNSLEVSGGRQG